MAVPIIFLVTAAQYIKKWAKMFFFGMFLLILSPLLVYWYTTMVTVDLTGAYSFPVGLLRFINYFVPLATLYNCLYWIVFHYYLMAYLKLCKYAINTAASASN